MCSKFKEANDFPKWQERDIHEFGKEVTFMKWQESDVHEMARKWPIKESLYERKKWIWLVSNKTNALSSLRTAQAGKSETRQNEKTYYKIQKGFICQ